MAEPNRWLHLRHPQGFSEERFVQFRAHCNTFSAYVAAVLANWRALPLCGEGTPPVYAFLAPELSADRRIATLPLGGECTIGSRALFEDGCSRLLWQFYPLEFLYPLEEGFTESLDPSQSARTSWRLALRKNA